MAITKDGIEIRDLDDWRDRAGPKRTDQWVAHRSAMEAARAWLEGGGQRLPREIESVLRSHPAFGPVIRWDAEPEVQLRFDAFAGEPRNSDLVVHATDAHGPFLIAVEAKADESFGDTVADTLVAAERRYLQNSNSNGVTRVGQLRQALFGSTEGGDGLPAVEGLRYQLLTACAGGLAEATHRGYARSLMLVQEFQTPKTQVEKHDANAQDLNAFLTRLSRGAVTGVAAGEIVGPFTVPGSLRISNSVQLYLGKVTRDLRA